MSEVLSDREAEIFYAEQRGYASAMEAERKLHEARIEELEVECNKAALWAREQHASADRYAARIEELEAKLATCEKYRDAYAECDRIGTQAVRDLEARAERLEEALLWCSGSADFNEGGVAREGWLKVCAPLLTGDKT